MDNIFSLFFCPISYNSSFLLCRSNNNSLIVIKKPEYEDFAISFGSNPINKTSFKCELNYFNSKIDEVVGPILTQFGYHIIKINNKRPFEDGEEQVNASIFPSV